MMATFLDCLSIFLKLKPLVLRTRLSLLLAMVGFRWRHPLCSGWPVLLRASKSCSGALSPCCQGWYLAWCKKFFAFESKAVVSPLFSIFLVLGALQIWRNRLRIGNGCSLSIWPSALRRYLHRQEGLHSLPCFLGWSGTPKILCSFRTLGNSPAIHFKVEPVNSLASCSQNLFSGWLICWGKRKGKSARQGDWVTHI